MTGGIGFVSTGKSNDRRNRGLLKHTDSVMSRKDGPHKGSDMKPKIRKVSEGELKAFKEKFHAQQKRDKIKMIVISVVVTSVVILTLYWMIY